MPYNKEKANKLSYERIIKDQVIKKTLNNYKIVFDVNDSKENIDNIKSKFIENKSQDYKTIDYIFTVDSSFTEIPVNEEIPTAKIGLVNFSSAIICLDKKSEIYENGFINPHKFNDIYNSNILTFICPTFNVVTKDNPDMDVIDCIRKEIYEFYYNNSPFNTVKLIESLFNVMNSNMESFVLQCTNEYCPTNDETAIGSKGIIFKLEEVGIKTFECPYCKKTMYITDYLRLHETMDLEFGQNTLLTRFSQVTEHLIAINLIDTLIKFRSFSLLSKTALIIDGPLAIYGEPAKLNRSLLKYLHHISDVIGSEIVYFGMIKTGKLKDHFTLINNKIKSNNNQIPENSFLLVDDSYRFKYIQKAPKKNIYFGQEVLYGQDFLFYSKDRKKFVLSMLYPVDSRDIYFGEKVFNYNNYKNLSTIFNLINNISIDIYEDAVLPVALAHKYAAISLNPGTNILEKFIKEYID